MANSRKTAQGKCTLSGIQFRFSVHTFALCCVVLVVSFDEGDAFSLVIEGVRESEVHPTGVFAFLHVPYWATKPLIATDVHRCRVSEGNNESLVSEGWFSTEIFWPVDTSTFLKCLQGTAVSSKVGFAVPQAKRSHHKSIASHQQIRSPFLGTNFDSFDLIFPEVRTT